MDERANPPRPAERRGEGFTRDDRLRRRAEFLHCYRQGRRRGGPLATLFFVPNALPHPRLGISASRKVGGAVVRQQLKRRMREIYRRWKQRGRLPSVDLVFNLKPAAAAAGFPDLQREVERQLGSLLGERRRRRERSS
ncbi:MAG TPA: ribonuclease P protein component [Thermoanaerobaculia bacterium]|nr:ribonuclease P protein component [Thermoanaerobaculia bacterium]